MLKSGCPSLCLVECIVLHCVAAMETQTKPASCGGALFGSKVFPAVLCDHLFVGPCQEKIFNFEHTVFGHCQIAMASLWNKMVEMAGAHMEACGLAWAWC